MKAQVQHQIMLLPKSLASSISNALSLNAPVILDKIREVSNTVTFTMARVPVKKLLQSFVTTRGLLLLKKLPNIAPSMLRVASTCGLTRDYSGKRTLKILKMIRKQRVSNSYTKLT
jgi:hypothetical protein